MIPKETIDKIFDAARIEEVVGDFVVLKKRGVNMLGLCPFHNEKTPSFTVSPAKGIYKCFGCGEAGNAIKFVMQHESMTYPEALKYLGGKYGIEIKEEERSEEHKKKEAEHESMMRVTAFAQAHFIDRLKNHEKGIAIGLQYFNERGFSDYIIEKFQLGYALESWDDLQKSAVAKGFVVEALVKTGLVVKTDDGKIYDRFRDRVIFPIHNISGRPIGFGGRILDATKSKAKYVNSPESEIYHKSDVLYGIHLARTAIVKNDNCYLVEGYTDVISIHMAGIENVVSSSGTSLTKGQIKLIRRYTKNITILYDGDAAGIKASFRGIDMIIEEGLNVRIVLFPDGEDPDSFARSHSAEELTNFLKEQSKDFILFKSDMLKDEAGDDPVRKAAMIKDIVESISLVPENIDRLLYTREASQIVNIDEQILVNEVNKYRRRRYQKNYSKPTAPIDIEVPPIQAEKQVTKTSSRLVFEKELVRILLLYGHKEIDPNMAGLGLMMDGAEDEKYNVAEFIVSSLFVDEMTIQEDDTIAQIYKEFQEAIQQGTLPSEQFFTMHENEDISQSSINLITFPHNLSPNWEEKHKIYVALEDEPKILSRLVLSAVFDFKIMVMEKDLHELRESLKNPNLSVDEITEILNNIAAMTRTKNKMASGKGIVVTGSKK